MDENNPIQKNCKVCGVVFDAYHHREGVLMLRSCYLDSFCPECKRLIDEVDWFGHHKRTPTKELLEKELRKKIKSLEKMASSRR